MAVTFKHYENPRPRGATKNGCFLGFAGIMTVVTGLVIATLVWPGGEVHFLLFFGWTFPVGVYLVIWGGLVLWRNSRWAALRNDSRASGAIESGSGYSLLLRPFEFDGVVPLLPADGRDIDEFERDPGGLSDFEERDLRPPVEMFDALASSLGAKVPLIAVGDRRPNHRGGPGLVEIEHYAWRRRVTELMKGCNHIFIMPWPTEGTMWELERIISSGSTLKKTIFIMPPAYGVKKVTRMVTSSTLEMTGEEDFYLKVPIGRVDEEHLIRSIRRGYLEAVEVLKREGLVVPAFDENGGVFSYRSGVLLTRPIPYSQEEMDSLVESFSH